MAEKPTYEELEQRVAEQTDELVRLNKELKKDLAERKRAEEKLHTAENSLKSTLNTSPNIISKANIGTGHFVEVSPIVTKILGFSVEEFTSRPLMEFIHPDDRQRTIHEVSEQLKGKEVAFFENRYVCKDGSYKWMAWFGTPADKNGIVTAIGSDITERKQAEAALRESENRFQIAMEATKDGLYDWNLVTNEIYYSPGWKRMIGYADDELPNDFSVWENLTDAEDAKRSWKMQNELIHKQRDRFEMEFEMKHKDGHWVDILSRAKAIFDKDGKAIRIIGTHVDISERKQAEKTTREKEEALRLSLDAAKAGTWTWDVQTGEVVWDDQMQKIFGLEPGTFKGTFGAWKERVHPDDMKTAERITLNALKRGERYEFEYRVKGQSGEWNIINAQAAVMKDTSGKPIRMSGFAVDITERKQAEETLRKSEQLLSTHLLNTPIGAISWNLDFEVVEWNPAAEAIFGYTKREAIGKHATELILPEETRELVDGVFQDLLTEEGGTRSTNENITKDGRRIICDWYNTTLKDADGEVTGVASLVHDITERKRAEVVIRNREQLLNEMGNLGKIGGWEHDLVTGKATWTKETYKIVGIESGAIPGPEEHLNYYPPKDRDLLEEAYRRAMETGEQFDLELQGTTAKGRLLFVRAVGRPEFKDGKCIKMKGTLQDITERKKLEDQLQQSRKMEAIGTLTGGIAHDYNNLMSIIMGNLSIAMEDAEPGSVQADCLNEANIASHKVRNLTHELMSLSRGGAPVKEIGSLKELLQSASDVIPVDGSISLKESISQELWQVAHDPYKLGAVFRNVATNAVEAMSEGGTLTITAENLQIEDKEQYPGLPLNPGDYVHIFFQDQGVGIPEAHLNKIFDPYFSTKAMGVQKGMGLGLATAYAIVQKHGGHIAFDSSPGVGTTVNIYLTAESGRSEIDTSMPPKDASSSPKIRVLVMDDEEMLRKLARLMFERTDYAVETVKDGLEAIDAYKRQKDLGDPFGAVILDLTIKGGMGGGQTIQELLKIDPDVKAIVCSGYFDDPVMSDFEKYGFKGALTKPYEKKALKEVLERLSE